MNYRHTFHAGNFADVFKHAMLVELLLSLHAKQAPFCYVDTHAGRGLYDLRGAEAERTHEYKDGVLRLLEAARLPPLLDTYVRLVRSRGADREDALTRYPGSPVIASMLMREQDRAIACELRPDDAAALRVALRGDARFAIHCRDGYEALKALLPPEQKRGVVLVDPPFEAQAGEFALIEQALAQAIARWPQAILAVWYPVKLRESVAPFHRWLARCDAREVLLAELLLHPDNSGLRLNGCGIAIVTPPWQLEHRIREWLPALKDLLAQGRYGSWRVDWLKRD